MEGFLQDFRHSLRQLTRNPGFALTAVISLALGVGATVAVFSVIYGVLLHPFPYADIDRIANLSISGPQGDIFDAMFTGLQFRDLEKLHAFQSIASWRRSSLTVTGREIPEPVIAFYGIGSTFPTLGVSTLLGRNLGPSDSPDGQEPQPVVVLHYRFWQRHFNGDPAVIGKTLELNHKAYTIVGVTRPNFTWDWGADVYLPQEISDPKGGGVVIKLRPGVTLAAADAELKPMLQEFAKEYPSRFPSEFKVDIRLLTWEVKRNIGSTLYLLFAAVGVLLAIGCSNVSILLLARGTARRHEFAVRCAVGAGSFRIVRQLLTESLLLALTGTTVGVLLAYRLLAVIVAWLPPHLFPPDVSAGINLPVLLFSVGLALLTPVLFGLVPALQMARPQIGQVMQSSTRKIAGSVHGKWLHGTLVATQIALTLLLLTAAGAATESFVQLLHIPLGYDPHNVIAASIPLQDNTYTTWQGRANYFEKLRASVASLPDVVSAAISNNGIPPDSGWEQQIELLGKPAASPEAQTARANLVGPDYFHTLHTPLLEGRVWSASEVSRGAAMVLVSETFTKRYMPNGDAVGRFIKLPEFANLPPGIEMAPGADGWLQVIGVVGDARNDGLDRPVRPAIFAPYSLVMFPGAQIFVRCRVAPDSILQDIRKRLAAANPDQQASRMETLEK
jgi:predicted permease